MRKIEYIVIHHTDAKWGNANKVVKWHTNPKPEGRGWSRAGYHYIINNGFPTYRSYSIKKKVLGWDGKIEWHTSGLVREKNYSNGVLGFNSKLINVCMIGDFDAEDPTEKQIKSLAKVCKALMKKYNLSYDKVVTHTEAIKIREKIENKKRKDTNKICPGERFKINEFRALLNGEELKSKICPTCHRPL